MSRSHDPSLRDSADAEQQRLDTGTRRDPGPWKRWGPYLSERAWGTVREDYSEDGTAWEHFPHDEARSRAYRWNEDGLAGVCDIQQRLCFALALWNHRDPIVKERVFGLTGNEGNHGEDAKELWWYVDSTPTHSWMRWHYWYPQKAYPYETLVAENRRRGTKAAARYALVVPAGETVQLRLRLRPRSSAAGAPEPFADEFETVMALRSHEADEFYRRVIGDDVPAEEAVVARRALAGMLWSKQLYIFDIEQWLDGDPAEPAPPAARRLGRNARWRHLNNFDVLSMPDKWEYPWYAAWDLAFHCVTLARVDPDFAKHQLTLLCREWYMHPNGQLPAYEWAFDDVNPPVHAWAALRVFEIDGCHDTAFLEALFHKLLLNFTWWVNRKDAEGNNLFEGGFLGLDNIGPFDRSKGLPTGGYLEQSDGTAWMAMYCLNLLEIALVLADHDDAYEDVATKFFEHFAYIATAMNRQGLWDEQLGFYRDLFRCDGGEVMPIRAVSMVGLIPLFAVAVLDEAGASHQTGWTGLVADLILGPVRPPSSNAGPEP